MSDPRVSEVEPQTEQEFEGMEVDAPRVGIVMGSKSDMAAMDAAAEELKKRDIGHEVRVMSAHRDPDVVADYAKNAKMRGLRVIIAGAGLSAALPGVVEHGLFIGLASTAVLAGAQGIRVVERR